MKRHMKSMGRWGFWRATLHGRLRRQALGSMAGLTPLMVMVLMGLWWDVHCTGYFFSEEYNEGCFREACDGVVAWVEDYRRENGHLPDSLAIDWLVPYDGWAYVDTTRWDRMVLHYRHWGDSVYKLVHDYWAWYVSSPEFKGYMFWRWDGEWDSVRVNTVEVPTLSYSL